MDFEEITNLLQKHYTKKFSLLQLQKSAEAIVNNRITLIPKGAPSYPKAFLELKDPPKLLFVQGALPAEEMITIVGTRTASHYGKEACYKIAKELASAGVPVVSGLARGIDSAAHKGALAKDRTVAIIGSGLLQLYPRENQNLAREICERGALVSEYPPFTPPTRYSFIKRNRLLAALGKVSLLIESPLKGGSMVTMECAKELKRPLFALPATIDMPSFTGNFSLIKKNSAQLVVSAEDLLPFFSKATPKKEKRAFFDLNEEELVVYNALMGREKSIEELVLLTQTPIMKLNVLLTSLLLKGAVSEFSGKLYKKRDL